MTADARPRRRARPDGERAPRPGGRRRPGRRPTRSTAAQVGERLVAAWRTAAPDIPSSWRRQARRQPCRLGPRVRSARSRPCPSYPSGQGTASRALRRSRMAQIACSPPGRQTQLPSRLRRLCRARRPGRIRPGRAGAGRLRRLSGMARQRRRPPRLYVAVAWTDEREGQGDILLSWYDDGTWSEDLPLPGASGPEEQGHPSIALDDAATTTPPG